MDGANFAQALVFGWMTNPEASYSFLQQMLEVSGCDVSAQALEKRMTPQTADFLLSLLHAFMYACIASEPVMTELLDRFERVSLQDGTVIGLPNAQEAFYKGCGCSTSESGKSGLRIQARLNLNTGHLQGPWIASAAACERKGAGSSMQQEPMPANGLFLTDIGIISLDTVRTKRRVF